MKKGQNAPTGEALPKGIELDKNSQKLVDEAMKSLTLGKRELSPSERLELLRRRERTISESAEKLKHLQKLRSELDELRAWEFGNGPQRSKLTLEGEGSFTTTNTGLISLLKGHLIVLFEQKEAELEKELTEAVI